MNDGNYHEIKLTQHKSTLDLANRRKMVLHVGSTMCLKKRALPADGPLALLGYL